MLSKIFGFLGGGAIEGVTNGIVKVKEVFSGNQAERDRQEHAIHSKGMDAYQAEWASSRRNRTLWDSFWDGMNRMPRPVIVMMTLAYFGLSYFDPHEFQIVNLALDTVPERMWWIAGGLMGFYFSAREISKFREKKKMAMDDDAFATHMAKIENLEKLKAEREQAKAEKEKARAEIAKAEREANPSLLDRIVDTAEDEINDAIEAWKRKKESGTQG